jgi:hypothetical protein
MSLSTRQINRMLSGAQPNPVERLIKCLQSSDPDIGDEALGFICSEAGGHFVKDEGSPDTAAVNAVRECAEAIAAISDGKLSRPDEKEVREAICALTALLRIVQAGRETEGPPGVVVRPLRSEEPAASTTPAREPSATGARAAHSGPNGRG